MSAKKLAPRLPQLSEDRLDQAQRALLESLRTGPRGKGVSLKVLSAAQWNQVVGVLSGQALFVAKLLAGEMPLEQEADLVQRAHEWLTERAQSLPALHHYLEHWSDWEPWP